jgi:hypothetical protein
MPTAKNKAKIKTGGSSGRPVTEGKKRPKPKPKAVANS